EVWVEVVRSRSRVLDEIAARLRGTRASNAGLDEVLERQPGGTALVSYLRCEGQRYPVRHDAEYVAFVARERGRPIVIRSLGRAPAIDSLIGRWREAIGEHAAGAARARRWGAALRARIWDPLLPALGESPVVRVVPDAAIHGVNFYALPTARGYLLDDRREIDLVSTERSLARPRSRVPSSGRLVAFGGIRYGP